MAKNEGANQRQVEGEHYKQMTVEPWDAMEAWMTPEEFRGYLKGNAIKYLARDGHKPGDNVGKAAHYQEKLQEFEARSGDLPLEGWTAHLSRIETQAES